jgi:uncharacterized cupredoxin-like copper-binding protein
MKKSLVKQSLSILISAGLLVPVAVFAHGTQEHKKSDSSSQPVFEQTDWGIAGTPAKINRTVNVVMSDKMRFEPSSLQFKEGETVKFIVKNEGKLMHEFVLGTKDKNLEHAGLMKKFPGMAHDEPYMAHVAPGKTTEMVWTFNRSGEFEFACLIAGHFDAGMRGPLTVAKSAGAGK